MGGKGGEEKEPSAELKAAVKACTENELCKQLMECMKKHTESGGKGDHGLRFEHHQQPNQHATSTAAGSQSHFLRVQDICRVSVGGS